MEEKGSCRLMKYYNRKARLQSVIEAEPRDQFLKEMEREDDVKGVGT